MKSTTYISIDVATKSLAIGIYRLGSFDDILQNAPSKQTPHDLNEYCNSMIQILSMNVFDINNGIKLKDTNVIEKACALKRTLENFDASIEELPDDIIVLIEYQMNANHMSNAIFNMIVYHYSNKYPVHVVMPSMKNTIALHPNLVHAEFLARASNNYKANKDHTKYNMLYLLMVFDKLHMIKDIKKKNYDDIADTLCQCLAWHKHQTS